MLQVLLLKPGRQNSVTASASVQSSKTASHHCEGIVHLSDFYVVKPMSQEPMQVNCLFLFLPPELNAMRRLAVEDQQCKVLLFLSVLSVQKEFFVLFCFFPPIVFNPSE